MLLFRHELSAAGHSQPGVGTGCPKGPAGRLRRPVSRSRTEEYEPDDAENQNRAKTDTNAVSDFIPTFGLLHGYIGFLNVQIDESPQIVKSTSKSPSGTGALGN